MSIEMTFENSPNLIVIFELIDFKIFLNVFFKICILLYKKREMYSETTEF